jgi:hypothetical protein
VIGNFRITLPEGLRLASGDTTFADTITRVYPARVVRVTMMRPGAYEVRAVLAVGNEAEGEELQEADLLVRFADGVFRPRRVRLGGIRGAR